MIVIDICQQLDYLCNCGADVYDVDFFTAFQATPEIIRVGDVASAYYKDLAMLYLFTALGAFSTIKKCFK